MSGQGESPRCKSNEQYQLRLVGLGGWLKARCRYSFFSGYNGAPGRTRTSTPLRATDFESAASTSSATGALKSRRTIGCPALRSISMRLSGLKNPKLPDRSISRRSGSFRCIGAPCPSALVIESRRRGKHHENSVNCSPMDRQSEPIATQTVNVNGSAGTIGAFACNAPEFGRPISDREHLA